MLLESIAQDMRLTGVVTGQTVTVIAVQSHGPTSATLTYSTDSGDLAQKVVSADDAAGFDVAPEQRWTFDADGEAFRLASEARRIDWAHLFDPFTAVERDGLIYGRGACDMKGFIACALAMAPAFAEAKLKRPVHFAFTYDEEVGCFGARALMGAIADWGVKPATCIIGEPTSMRIIEGHKGCYEYTTAFTGVPGHASEPDRGVNAIAYAGRFLARLAEMEEQLKARVPEGSLFTPPWTTLQPGVIRGGIARNVIPDACEVEWEMRPVNAADARFALDRIRAFLDGEIDPEMRAKAAEAGVTTLTVGEVDGLEPLPDSQALALVRELTGGNTADVVSFGTEAGLFQTAGISTVVCGPGSIEQAHKPDEFVSLEQLGLCLDMLERLRDRLAA